MLPPKKKHSIKIFCLNPRRPPVLFGLHTDPATWALAFCPPPSALAPARLPRGSAGTTIRTFLGAKVKKRLRAVMGLLSLRGEGHG